MGEFTDANSEDDTMTEVRSLKPAKSSRKDRKISFAAIFVWSIVSVLFLISIVWIAKYGRNIPLNEDWDFVSALTGRQNSLFSWSWAQHNEHRIPLPRLVLFFFLKTTGDFRAGMFLNTALLAAASVMLVLTSKHLRNGKISFTDAFFPVALLHLGNSENLFWSCNVAIVLPAVILFLLLILFVTDPLLIRARSIFTASISAIMLPLSGAIGLMFAPFMALWLFYRAADKSYTGKRRAVLLLSAIATAGLIFLYFQNFHNLRASPPEPVIPAVLLTSGKFIALSFGIAVDPHWNLFILITLSLLLYTAVRVLKSVFQTAGFERRAATGTLLLIANTVGFALAVGWGRADQAPYRGLPARYTVLALPVLILSYLLSETYGTAGIKKIIQWGLLMTVVLLFPANTMEGLGQWKDWYVQGMISVEQDLNRGISAEDLAQKRGNFLIYYLDKEDLAAQMRLLHDAGIGPFRLLKASSIPPK